VWWLGTSSKEAKAGVRVPSLTYKVKVSEMSEMALKEPLRMSRLVRAI
jgi:hypothetical protein